MCIYGLVINCFIDFHDIILYFVFLYWTNHSNIYENKRTLIILKIRLNISLRIATVQDMLFSYIQAIYEMFINFFYSNMYRNIWILI